MAATAIKQFLDQRHESFQELAPDYEFLAAAYEGGRAFIESNLFRQSPRETEIDFRRRRDQAVYPNYVRPVLKTYRDHVFKRGEAVTRSIDDDAYLAWLDDVDFAGNSANAFWGTLAVRMLLYGWMGILVDMPIAPNLGRDVTVTDALDLRLQPYLVQLPPMAVADWSADPFGRLNWVHLLGTETIDATPLKPRQTVTTHTVWDRETWRRYSDDGESLGQGTHGLGVVPFVFASVERSERWPLIGTSFMADFARMNRALMNMLSLRGEFLAKNALQILTLQLQPMASDDGGDEQLVIRNLLEYAGEHAPQFIGPNVAGAEWMFRHVEDLRQQMYFASMLQDPTARSATQQGESGIAKQIDFEQTNSALAQFADALEQAESRVTWLWFLWQARDWEPGWGIDYPDTFSVRSLADDLETVQNVRQGYGDVSPTFTARVLERIAARILDDATEEDRQTIQEELTDNLASLSDAATGAGRMESERMRTRKMAEQMRVESMREEV